MNKSMTTATMCLLLSLASKGELDASKLSQEQKQTLVKAIRVLKDSGAMTVSPHDHQALKLAPGLLEVLSNEGLLEAGNSEAQTVCISTGN